MPIDYDPSRTALYHPERRDTVFEPEHAYSPIQLAVEAARLAYYRAEDSSIEMQRLTETLARVGFGAPVMFVDVATGAAGFGSVNTSNGASLLALRGTQPDDITDIGRDLEAELVPWPESAGRVHAGFALSTRALLPHIRQWIGQTQLDLRKAMITGHSLGAAMATLAASVLRPGYLVTLGSPRVGSAEFVATVSVQNIVRLVNCCDVVTRVPPEIGGYTHLPTRIYLNRHGSQVSNPTQSLVDLDRVDATVEYLTAYAWRVGAVPVRDLADHAPINYARALFS
jgi:hypothetical protein